MFRCFCVKKPKVKIDDEFTDYYAGWLYNFKNERLIVIYQLSESRTLRDVQFHFCYNYKPRTSEFVPYVFTMKKTIEEIDEYFINVCKYVKDDVRIDRREITHIYKCDTINEFVYMGRDDVTRQIIF
jgi:hypothetical protein